MIVYGFLIFFVGFLLNDIVWFCVEIGIVVFEWGRVVLKFGKFIFMEEINENG